MPDQDSQVSLPYWGTPPPDQNQETQAPLNFFGQMQGQQAQAQPAQQGFDWHQFLKQAGQSFAAGYKGQSLQDQQAQAHMNSLQSNPMGQGLAKLIKKLFPGKNQNASGDNSPDLDRSMAQSGGGNDAGTTDGSPESVW